MEERPNDQIELSGGWGGFFGFVGTVGLVFNNFSIKNIVNLAALLIHISILVSNHVFNFGHNIFGQFQIKVTFINIQLNLCIVKNV